MQLGNLEIEGKVVVAPMAGVTDWAFRTVCAQQGASVTVTEMVSSRALVYQDKKSVALLKRDCCPVMGAQIFGNDPTIMGEAAVLALNHSGADFIDINMGCPMPKIANSGDGSGLMRSPDLAYKIVEAVVEAVDVPVTIKTRLGWDKGSIHVVEFTKAMEQAGASAIAVHGRTRSMLYSGLADWDMLAKVKENLTVPFIANGDIFTAEDGVKCMARTGADMVMVGRGAFGNPFLFAQLKAALAGETVPEVPCLRDRIDLAVRQIEMASEDKTERVACLEARKQLNWYLRGVSHGSYYKEKIAHVSTLEEIYKIAKGIQRDLR
ncbi:MAG: tRNA dihydrouridine synthase DusB [Eubacteriales bacterium]